MSERELRWDGLTNARDLGGLPVGDGASTTVSGVFVRSETVRRLTERGWLQLEKYGVRTVVDLRFAEERADDPPLRGDLRSISVSLFGTMDPDEGHRTAELVRRAPDMATAIELLYVDVLETRGSQIAQVLEAIAKADDGGILVHCFVGKDRTGIVVALLLALAGVPTPAIVDDYALSEARIAPLVDAWIDEARTEEDRIYRKRVSGAPARGMERALATLDQRFGGVVRYLGDVGLESSVLERLRERLRNPG